MNLDKEIESKIGKWALGILSSVVIGLFVFLWNLNSELAVIKSKQLQDKASIETADKVLKDWSKMERTVEGLERQMQNMWKNYNKALEEKEKAAERVTRLEAKLEYCCH